MNLLAQEREFMSSNGCFGVIVALAVFFGAVVLTAFWRRGR